ncbi:uncharacterized protein LOC116225162 [Clupea harengus]|uniref:Uncharacterized protein LOC116225162 n=1 Tax=Clupea harengus TaxID=7950 RepID=A0A8M1KRM7_CLUHA|nr:uncharacterized protein LOC116225162 [Clupea harengus]
MRAVAHGDDLNLQLTMEMTELRTKLASAQLAAVRAQSLAEELDEVRQALRESQDQERVTHAAISSLVKENENLKAQLNAIEEKNERWSLERSMAEEQLNKLRKANAHIKGLQAELLRLQEQSCKTLLRLESHSLCNPLRRGGTIPNHHSLQQELQNLQTGGVVEEGGASDLHPTLRNIIHRIKAYETDATESMPDAGELNSLQCLQETSSSKQQLINLLRNVEQQQRALWAGHVEGVERRAPEVHCSALTSRGLCASTHTVLEAELEHTHTALEHTQTALIHFRTQVHQLEAELRTGRQLHTHFTCTDTHKCAHTHTCAHTDTASPGSQTSHTATPGAQTPQTSQTLQTQTLQTQTSETGTQTLQTQTSQTQTPETGTQTLQTQTSQTQTPETGTQTLQTQPLQTQTLQTQTLQTQIPETGTQTLQTQTLQTQIPETETQTLQTQTLQTQTSETGTQTLQTQIPETGTQTLQTQTLQTQTPDTGTQTLQTETPDTGTQTLQTETSETGSQTLQKAGWPKDAALATELSGVSVATAVDGRVGVVSHVAVDVLLDFLQRMEAMVGRALQAAQRLTEGGRRVGEVRRRMEELKHKNHMTQRNQSQDNMTQRNQSEDNMTQCSRFLLD